MTAEPQKNHRYESPFSSRDCTDIVVDGPGDNTVRPLTGDLLKRAMAEREKIAHWEALGFKHECIDIEIVIDGLEDTTVRPMTGESLKRAIAERDRVAYWESLGYGKKPPKKDETKPS